jgi:hypothetical protein
MIKKAHLKIFHPETIDLNDSILDLIGLLLLMPHSKLCPTYNLVLNPRGPPLLKIEMVSGWKIFKCAFFIIKISLIFAFIIRINLQKEKIHRRTGDILKNSSCMCSLNLNWGLKIK